MILPLKPKLPAPVHRTVPAFSNPRPKETELGTARLRVAPAATMVDPAPLIVPPVQFIALPTVIAPVPLRVPLIRSRFATVRVALSVTMLAPPLIRYSPAPLSCAPALSAKVPPLYSTRAVGGTMNRPLPEPPAPSRLVVPAERLTTPLLTKLPLQRSVPAWISTVP